MAKKKTKRPTKKEAAGKESASKNGTPTGKPRRTRRHNPAKARVWQVAFLRILRKHNQLALAAEAAGVSRRHVYTCAKKDRKFRTEITEARRMFREDNIARLEGELLRRALVTDHKKKDTRALLTALRRFDPDHYDRPKNQNVNLGGQPGNQLPVAPNAEHRISIVRIVDINSHADAELFRKIQRERQATDEVIDEIPPPSIGSNEPTNGKHEGNGKQATNGKAGRQ